MNDKYQGNKYTRHGMKAALDFENRMDEIQSAGTNAKIAYTTDQTARSTRNATRATALTDKKSTLAAKRKAQESAADKQYNESE